MVLKRDHKNIDSTPDDVTWTCGVNTTWQEPYPYLQGVVVVVRT